MLCATKQRVDACGLMPAVVTCAGQHGILESCTGKQTCKHNGGYENLPVTYKLDVQVTSLEHLFLQSVTGGSIYGHPAGWGTLWLVQLGRTAFLHQGAQVLQMSMLAAKAGFHHTNEARSTFHSHRCCVCNMWLAAPFGCIWRHAKHQLHSNFLPILCFISDLG